MKKITLIILLMAALLAGFACEKQKPPSTLDEAIAEAATEGKPLLIDFYATWCGPCKEFTRASQEDSTVKKALEGVVLYKIDCEKGEGIPLAEKFQIKGYPTYVVTNGAGEPIARWMGYSKENFLDHLDKATADPTTIKQKEDRFHVKSTIEDASALADYSSSIGDYKNAVMYLKEAQKLDPSADYSYEIFENTVRGVYKGTFTYEDAAMEADTIFTKENIDNQIHAAGAMAELASYEDKLDEMAQYLEKGISLVDKTENEETKKYVKSLNVKYSLNVKADTAEAIAYQKSFYTENWQDDPDQLNSFAWWCYENGVNLDEALTLAKKAVGLATSGAQQAMILDTVAHLYKAKGNMEEAVNYMQKAVDADPENSQWQETLDQFKEEMQQE
jgi:thioredoxin 1